VSVAVRIVLGAEGYPPSAAPDRRSLRRSHRFQGRAAGRDPRLDRARRRLARLAVDPPGGRRPPSQRRGTCRRVASDGSARRRLCFCAPRGTPDGVYVRVLLVQIHRGSRRGGRLRPRHRRDRDDLHVGAARRARPRGAVALRVSIAAPARVLALPPARLDRRSGHRRGRNRADPALRRALALAWGGTPSRAGGPGRGAVDVRRRSPPDAGRDDVPSAGGGSRSGRSALSSPFVDGRGGGGLARDPRALRGRGPGGRDRRVDVIPGDDGVQRPRRELDDLVSVHRIAPRRRPRVRDPSEPMGSTAASPSGG
jgi:hypothetical protein